MGELAVGDRVIGRDGRPHRVLGVYPQGEKPILRVTFSDGAATRVTPDHLWAVQSRWQRERRSSGRWQIRATSELGELRTSHKRGWRWSVPLMAPAQLEPSTELPLDPYVQGTLLRDDCIAPDLSFPETYLDAAAEDRRELLRGLLDDDRIPSGSTWIGFGTASPQLRDGVVDLVRSLGGMTTTTVGDSPGSQPFWQLHVHLPDPTHPPSRRVQRFITGVEADGVEEAQCILVDANDHLYVTDDYVVTHNTNMFLGVGILKVKGLFRKLRKLALRYGGVIVFFDEADSLGNRGALTPGPFGGQPQARIHEASEHVRWLSPETQAALFQARPRVVDGVIMGGMGGGGGMGTLQALLSELSGLKKPRGFFNRIIRRALGMQPKPPPKYRIMVMMASNMPQALDEALLRPGRIDRIYKVGYPAKEGRKRTYEGYLAKIRHQLDDEAVDKLATITPYATGASIKDLVNEALINAIRNDREVVEWTDVIHAKHLKELGPPEDVEYIQRERHAIAIHEACHAVTAYRTRRHLTIDLATIEKGGTYLGMVSSIKPEDQFTRWRSEYEADIVVSLASLAGERLFFEGDSSSGVSGDLESATTIAMLMEGHWGMGKTVTSHAVTHKVGIAGGGRPGGGGDDDRKDLLEGSLGERIETDLVELLARAKSLLTEHRADVLRLTYALETHKTLSGDDVVAVMEGTEGPLIDGRDYHDPEFTAALEQYHEVVVDAHKVHEKVTIALPRLNGQAPDDGEVAAATIPTP